MKKLLTAGAIAAIALATQGASATQCTGGFYAGLNIGFVNHNVKVKIKNEGEDAKTVVKRVLEGIRDVRDFYIGEGALVEELDQLKQAFVNALYEKFKITSVSATEVKGGEWYQKIAGKKYADHTADSFAQAILKDAYTDTSKTLDDAGNLKQAATTAMTKYNNAVKANIEKMATEIFSGAPTTQAYKNVWDNKSISIEGVTTQLASITTIDSKKTPLYTAANGTTVAGGLIIDGQSAVKNVAAITDQSTAKARKTTFETKFNSDDMNDIFKIIDADDGIEKEAARIANLESSEFVSNGEKKSKSKSGFIAEAVIGYDHFIDRMVVGADLYVGFDTTKIIACDEKIEKNKEESKKKENGIEVKRQFYAGIAPRAGFMITPEMEAYISIGAQIGRFKVDTTGLQIVYDHANKIVDQGKAIKAFYKNGAADLSAKVIEAEKVLADAKGTNYDSSKADAATVTKVEAAQKALDDVKAQQQSFDKMNSMADEHLIGIRGDTYSKTAFSPIVGAGIRYAFTKNVFGTIGYKFQFSTKIADYDKTEIVEVKDSNHTVTVGVGFRFDD